MKHKHEKSAESEPAPYDFCPAPHDCNPAAHGGYVIEQKCFCGATRLVAVNGRHTEYGPWRKGGKK